MDKSVPPAAAVRPAMLMEPLCEIRVRSVHVQLFRSPAEFVAGYRLAFGHHDAPGPAANGEPDMFAWEEVKQLQFALGFVRSWIEGQKPGNGQ